MASEKIAAMIEEVKALSVLELAELVHALEDEFGVSAAAAVAAAPAAGAAAPAEEEKTEFDLVLTEIGANKIAYAHHKDDLIETAFLSMLYEGRFYSFSPMTYLDRTKLTVIRPFIFIDEADIVSFARKQGLPVCKNPCPMDGYTRRQYVKELLHRIYEETPGADKRLFRAVIGGNIPGWPPANPNPRYNK